MKQSIQDRKRYVEAVRKSFHEGQTRQDRQAEEYETEEEAAGMDGFSSIRFRLFVAAGLFLAFLAWDRTGRAYLGYSPRSIITAVQKDQFQEQFDEAAAAVFKQFPQLTGEQAK